MNPPTHVLLAGFLGYDPKRAAKRSSSGQVSPTDDDVAAMLQEFAPLIAGG